MKDCSKRTQEGMTLIEVLVAVLILGVGLLGAAMIQLNALKYTDSSRMTGTIALNQRVYTITIAWDDARAANTTNAAEARRSFVLTSRVAVDPPGTPP